MSKKTNRDSDIGVAACLIELGSDAPTEIRITPAGKFSAKDGRPFGTPDKKWNITSALANAFTQQKDKFLIDYDHQTLYMKDHGQAAPAAAWFESLEWRDDGLYALGVEWTDKAKESIASKEYRYISPVLSYNKKTGDITGVLMAALVNFPAIDGLTDLAVAHFNLGEPLMNKDILIALSLEDDATDEAVLSSIKALQSDIVELNTKVAAPADPTKYVPIDTVAALQTELSTLTASIAEEKVSTLIDGALACGKLLPAQKEWAETLGAANYGALATFIDTAQPVAALAGNQTNGNAPEGDTTEALSADEKSIIHSLGITEEDYIKTKAEA